MKTMHTFLLTAVAQSTFVRLPFSHSVLQFYDKILGTVAYKRDLLDYPRNLHVFDDLTHMKRKLMTTMGLN